MITKTYSYGLSGLDVYPICIEVDVTRGLPATHIVGLPDSAIKESRERIRSAIRNAGYEYKPRRVTINLSPADIKKSGPGFDLAMAVAYLLASDQINVFAIEKTICLGELSLDGSLKAVRGVLPVALHLASKHRDVRLFVPQANAEEAALAEGVRIFPVANLQHAVEILTSEEWPPYTPAHTTAEPADYDVDFRDVKGQYFVKRGLEIAAAGSHNVLMAGPPGSGKSMMAQRLPIILPEMTREESLETTRIFSVMEGLKGEQGLDGLIRRRPFRAPHHTTSGVALVGGGSSPKPGEITLSHNGVLFLDELPEFSRGVLEALRQPLEDHIVTIARAARTLRFPCAFTLVAAMNPCPCGWLTDPVKRCTCSSREVQKYLARISGPLMDRIDLHIEVPAVAAEELMQARPGEESASIKKRTTAAREAQKERFRGTLTTANAFMSHPQLREFCRPEPEAAALLKQAIKELRFSARAHDKILKISRTIADLAGKERIDEEAVAEAVLYRSLDRDWWN